MPYNYTMKQCHTPLVKECDTAPTYAKPEIVCKTWFEAECNTTFSPGRNTRSLSGHPTSKNLVQYLTHNLGKRVT